jgi:hypothetical protein
MHNLTAALALVDREHPEQSPLVRMPRTAHGGLDRPVLGSHQDHLIAQLADWASLVADSGKPTVPTGLAVELEPQGPAVEGSTSATSAVTQANFETPVGTATRPAQVAPRVGAQLRPAWRPKDPFDPEIFNRQFGGGASSQSGPSK